MFQSHRAITGFAPLFLSTIKQKVCTNLEKSSFHITDIGDFNPPCAPTITSHFHRLLNYLLFGQLDLPPPRSFHIHLGFYSKFRSILAFYCGFLSSFPLNSPLEVLLQYHHCVKLECITFSEDFYSIAHFMLIGSLPGQMYLLLM